MLLFTTPSLVADSSVWPATTTLGDDELTVEASLDHGRHGVVVRAAGDHAAEVVGPTALSAEDEPVSSFHLPPYYRWESGPFSFRFTAEWREGTSSIEVSLRHMRSLRRHPRALVVEAEGDEPTSAIVIGTPGEGVDPDTDTSAMHVDWRGWHVIDADDPFDGPTRRILTTHTQVFGVGQSLM